MLSHEPWVGEWTCLMRFGRVGRSARGSLEMWAKCRVAAFTQGQPRVVEIMFPYTKEYLN